MVCRFYFISQVLYMIYSFLSSLYENRNLFFKTSYLKADFNVCSQKPLVLKLRNVLDIGKKK